ncbi:MAG: tetratricopeptide repeat protein [Syntrophobacteria bacterium]
MAPTQFGRIKWERARDLKKEGKLEEAERELHEAIEEEPDDFLLKSSLADLYVRQERLFEAKFLVQEILTVDPQFTQALVVQGEIFFKEKNFTEALENFRHASLRDNRPYLTLRIVRTLRQMERYEEALEIVDNALVAQRENTRLLKEKALILNRIGRFDEALELYERIRKLDPQDSFAQKELLRLKSLQRSDDEVIRELDAVVHIPSRQENAQLHALLAQKLKKAGQVKEAAAEYRTASRLQPDNVYFLKHQGFCHYNLGEYTRALECLVQAFRRDPSDFYVRGTLEKIYTSQGRLDEFIRLLEEVHQAHPHNVKLLGIINRLKKVLHAGKTEDK